MLNIDLETDGQRSAGHDPPTTPLELVQVIADLETGPATFAVPVHTVPSTVVPENLNSCGGLGPLATANRSFDCEMLPEVWPATASAATTAPDSQQSLQRSWAGRYPVALGAIIGTAGGAL